MERYEYEKLNQSEDTLWWFNGLHANLMTAFERCGASKTGGAILDAGCGTGGFLRKLARDIPGCSTFGIDIDEWGAATARTKSSRPVCVGSVNSLPFADASFSTIISADVIYHQRTDDTLALSEFHRCLAPNGCLILNLPAYQWLQSAHDRAVHTQRRYTRTRLHSLLSRAGFGTIRSTYWNSVLFPLLVMRRMTSWRKVQSDVVALSRLLELAFRSIMRLENGLLRRGFVLPFGSSVLVTAVKL